MSLEQDLRQKVDFHVHYEMMNGHMVSGVIEAAKHNGVAALALVRRLEIDDNFPEYQALAQEAGIDLYFGVENTTVVSGELADLIYLAFDIEDNEVRKFFGKEERAELNRQIAKRQKSFLDNEGFTFVGLNTDNQDLLERIIAGEIPEKAINLCRLVAINEANQSHVSDLKLVQTETWEEIKLKYSSKPGYQEVYMLDSKFLWSLFFAYGKEGFIPIKREVSDVIDAVHNAGGVILYSPEGNFKQDVWSNLIEKGIDGIMAWHGGELELGKDTIREIRKRNLLVLGGSDYHPELNDWQVGVGNGEMFINPRRAEALKNRLGRNLSK